MSALLLAVDGGNAKTDLVLADREGRILSLVRGPGSSPHEHGVEGALDRIEALVIEAGAEGPVAYAELLLAGVDFPSEVRNLQARAQERGWADHVEVANDTFAVLRAGTDRGWGVAVVCGAGINCLGLGPDGREARFPALGDISGDWGGGQDVGRDRRLGGGAQRGRARAEDAARAPRAGALRPRDTTRARGGRAHRSGVQASLHRARAARVRRGRRMTRSRQGSSPGSPTRSSRSCAWRSSASALCEEPADVVLGGGLMQARNPRLLDVDRPVGSPSSACRTRSPSWTRRRSSARRCARSTRSAQCRRRYARLRGDDRLTEVSSG